MSSNSGQQVSHLCKNFIYTKYNMNVQNILYSIEKKKQSTAQKMNKKNVFFTIFHFNSFHRNTFHKKSFTVTGN